MKTLRTSGIYHILALQVVKEFGLIEPDSLNRRALAASSGWVLVKLMRVFCEKELEALDVVRL